MKIVAIIAVLAVALVACGGPEPTYINLVDVVNKFDKLTLSDEPPQNPQPVGGLESADDSQPQP